MYVALAALSISLASDPVDAGGEPASPNLMPISETVSKSSIVVEATVESITRGHSYGPVDDRTAQMVLLRVDETFKGTIASGLVWLWLSERMRLEAGQRVTLFGGAKVGDRTHSLTSEAPPKAQPLSDMVVPLFENSVVVGPLPSGNINHGMFCFSGQDRWTYIRESAEDPCAAEDLEGLRNHLRELGHAPKQASAPASLQGVVLQ